MNRTNSASVPSQYNAPTKQVCVSKAPAHSNSSANNEVYSIISSVTNEIDSRWNPVTLMSPPSVGSTIDAHASPEATTALFDRWMPALTNCVCQNDMIVASPNSGFQMTQQMSTGSMPQTNFSLGSNGTGAYINATPSDSGWPPTNLSLNRGRPYTNSTVTGDRPHAILPSISAVPSTKSVHAGTKSTSISGNPHTKPPLFPVRQHTNPAAGIYVQASTSAGFHTNPTGPSPNANRAKYRAGGVQPPANSLHPNISGNDFMGLSTASITLTKPKTPSNQNSIMAQDMQQLQQPLQFSPTCQINTVAVGGICAQRLQQYLSDWNSRPTDNNILFWRSFVAKYYANNSKSHICMLTCKDKASMSLQHLQEKWKCFFCKEFSDNSDEISFDQMAERFQKQFEPGVRMLLSLGPCKEKKLPCGSSMIVYKEMIRHAMSQSGSTIFEGLLLVVFNTELKISQWDFCVRRSEVFVSRTVLGSQMDELLQTSNKYEESQDGNESGRDPQLEDKIIKLNCEFVKSRTFQEIIAGINSTRNRINLAESLQKTNPTTDPMKKRGNPTLNPNPLKRSFLGNGLERDPHPGQQVTRQRLEASTSNNNSSNNASANMPSTSKNNSSNNASANMAASTSSNYGNNNASANLAKDLLRQKHHVWWEGIVDKILAAENLNDLHALLDSNTN